MQRFIELGDGYGELFELEQLIHYNHPRIDKALFLTYSDDTATFLLIMNPASDHFQAIYTMFRGMTVNTAKHRKLTEWLEAKEIPITTFDTKSPDEFYERQQYYQYITGVLRLNHLVPPLR